MITEIVLFRLPDGMSREEAIAKYRLSVPGWRANPDLVRKTFLFDEKGEVSRPRSWGMGLNFKNESRPPLEANQSFNISRRPS
jgi:hypothetical protein